MKQRMAHAMVVLSADKRKVGVLCCLLLFLGVAGVRAFVLSGPRSARASLSKAENESFQEEGTIPGLGKRASKPGLALKTDIKVAPPPPLARDLFRLNEEHFPNPSQTELADAVAPKSPPANDETPAQRDDASGKLAERIAADLRRLRLRGTLLGGSPMAVIEVTNQKDKRGNVVRPGQVIEGFTLVEVSTSGVVLEKEGVRVELTRALPE